MSDSLYYIQREPKVSQENAPLLILLHGYGSHEEDLDATISQSSVLLACINQTIAE